MRDVKQTVSITGIWGTGRRFCRPRGNGALKGIVDILEIINGFLMGIVMKSAVFAVSNALDVPEIGAFTTTNQRRMQ